MFNKSQRKGEIPTWKSMNKKYLKELQTFLDMADNIENEDLRNDIICQMLKCDKLITTIAEEKINEASIKKS